MLATDDAGVTAGDYQEKKNGNGDPEVIHTLINSNAAPNQDHQETQPQFAVIPSLTRQLATAPEKAQSAGAYARAAQGNNPTHAGPFPQAKCRCEVERVIQPRPRPEAELRLGRLKIEVGENADERPGAENRENERRLQAISWEGPVHERGHVR